MYYKQAMDAPTSPAQFTSGAGAPAAMMPDDGMRLQAIAFGFLVQTLSNPDQIALFFPDTTDDGKKLLKNYGFDPERCNDLLQILRLATLGQVNANEAAQADRDSSKETLIVVSELKNGLSRNIVQTTSAFNYTMWMYIISFCAGLTMIAAAIGFAWVGKDAVFPLAFGTLGTASTITFFFTKPMEGLQSSRVGLTQLQVPLFSWFADWFNQQIMFQKNNKGLTLPEYEASASNLVDRTEKWMKMLHQAAHFAETADVITDPGKKSEKPD